jgi:catechol 2,3-dioxygenase-like lactoylglutathione lyase family enzyme
MMRLRLAALLLFLFFVTPAQEPTPALAGIAHVAFRVRDVAKSRDFYHALGFEEAFSFNDPGKPPVSYVKVNDRQFIELYGRADDTQPLGLMHVCYEAADIQSVWSEYAKRGIDSPQPRKARAGNLLFVFRDPENQVIEFTQYLPGSLHFEDRGKHLGEHRISQELVSAAVPVRDLASEVVFYKEKLAFEKSAEENTLKLSGMSGHKLQLASSDSAARITFVISDLAATSAELRRRSLNVTEAKDSVTVTDPDGNIVDFVRSKNAANSSQPPRSKN